MNKQKVGNRLAMFGFGIVIGVGSLMMLLKDFSSDGFILLGVGAISIVSGLLVGFKK